MADYQTKGRGQYKRNWESAEGQNLTFTLAFKPSQAERFHILTLACARSLVSVIEDEYNCVASIKWPNDVLVKGKKVAGLLTEAVFNGSKLDRLLVGIGININQEIFADEIDAKTISLKKVFGKKIDRERFLALFLSRIEYEYRRWHKQDDELLKWINRKIIGHGKWVGLRINGEDHSKKFKLLGVDKEGKLAVIEAEGGIKIFSHEQIRLITD